MNYLALTPNQDNVIEFVVIKHLRMPLLWSETYSYDENEVKSYKNNLKLKLSKGVAKVFYILNSEDIISFIWAEVNENIPKLLNIISLWTHKDFRQQGLSTDLKLKIEEWAIQKGLNKIKTSVSYKNHKMLNLNEKLGYNKTFIMMEKNLK